jgi:hypothetical protein
VSNASTHVPAAPAAAPLVQAKWKVTKNDNDGHEVYSAAVSLTPATEDDIYDLLASQGHTYGLTQVDFKRLLQNTLEAAGTLIRQGHSVTLVEALRLQLGAVGTTLEPLHDRGENLDARVTTTALKGLKDLVSDVQFRCNGVLTHAKVESARATYSPRTSHATITVKGHHLLGNEEAFLLLDRGERKIPLSVADLRVSDRTQVTFEVSTSLYPRRTEACLQLNSPGAKPQVIEIRN